MMTMMLIISTRTESASRPTSCMAQSVGRCHREDLRRLEAFHTRSHRQILGLQWFHFVSNDEVLNTSGFPHLGLQEIIDRRRLQLFGHVVRLESNVPAHRALRQAIGVRGNIRPGSRWRRPCGRPRQTWLRHIADGSPSGIRTE